MPIPEFFNQGDESMRMLTCDCGYSIKAKNDDLVIAKMTDHAKDKHPEMKLTSELLAGARAKIIDI